MKSEASYLQEDINKEGALEEGDSAGELPDSHFMPGTLSSETNWNEMNITSKIKNGLQTVLKSYKWMAFLLILGIISLILVLVLVYAGRNKGEKEIDYDNRPSERQVGKMDMILSLPVLPVPTSKPYEDSLQSLCAATIWREGLYVNCTNIMNLPGKPNGTGNPQGLFNVKNTIQVCIRWAIDAGMGLVMPRLAIRSRDNLEYFNEWQDFSFLFDEDHLKKSLKEECPQLKVIDYKDHVDRRIVAERKSFTYYSHGWFRYHVDSLLNTSGDDPSKASTVVWENEPLFSWEFYKDGVNTHQSLYNLIKFNPSFVAVGKEIVGLLPATYLGIHIRAEKDAEGFLGILNYHTQIENFINIYKEKYTHIKTIYVATGDHAIDEKFVKDVKDLNANVVTKWTLAATNSDLKDKLESVRFDQLAIMDYEVLRSSTFFFGMSLSSYTFGIGYERGHGSLIGCNCHIVGAIPSIFNCCF